MKKILFSTSLYLMAISSVCAMTFEDFDREEGFRLAEEKILKAEKEKARRKVVKRAYARQNIETSIKLPFPLVTTVFEYYKGTGVTAAVYHYLLRCYRVNGNLGEDRWKDITAQRIALIKSGKSDDFSYNPLDLSAVNLSVRKDIKGFFPSVENPYCKNQYTFVFAYTDFSHSDLSGKCFRFIPIAEGANFSGTDLSNAEIGNREEVTDLSQAIFDERTCVKNLRLVNVKLGSENVKRLGDKMYDIEFRGKQIDPDAAPFIKLRKTIAEYPI